MRHGHFDGDTVLRVMATLMLFSYRVVMAESASVQVLQPHILVLPMLMVMSLI